MKRTRQNSLQDRLSAMFRILPSVAASALVFSLVYFSPLIDLKDSNAAAAQSGDGGGGGSSGGGKGGGGDGGGGGRSGGDGGGRSGGDGGGRSSDGREGWNSEQEKRAAASPSQNSGQSASEKSNSGGLLNGVVKGSQFSGDSEPSGGILSRNQEREAIANGWK